MALFLKFKYLILFFWQNKYYSRIQVIKFCIMLELLETKIYCMEKIICQAEIKLKNQFTKAKYLQFLMPLMGFQIFCDSYNCNNVLFA